MNLVLATVKNHPDTVCHGKRVIGFMRKFKLRGVDGWRFIPNREDIASRCPVPPIVYNTADEALIGLNKILFN